MDIGLYIFITPVQIRRPQAHGYRCIPLPYCSNWILDAWIFSAGDSLIDCVWSGGLKVVAGGRHVFRDEIARQFVKTMAGLGQWSPR